MIGYVMIGTNDLPRATQFYDTLLAVIGGKRLMEFPTSIIYGVNPKLPGLGVGKPYDGKPATVGNGVMVAIAVDSKEKVHAVYDKAIELGGKDEGPAGPRGESFYAGYFRDLDGNKLCAFCVPK
jgi:catechol 2,3-dioxygenase-like lactoylglutathione lyase family enzyme